MSELQLIIEDGYCRTSGLRRRPGVRELSIRLEPLHLTAAALFLLQEVGNRQAAGKTYSEGSLFRYRSGAHLSQFLFKPGPWETLEMVDLRLEEGRVVHGLSAQAALSFFTQGCPHWDLGYGWPPRPTPVLGLPLLTPGVSSKPQVVEHLGKPTRGDTRWLFGSHELPIHIDTKWEGDLLTSVTSSHLEVGELVLTSDVTADQLETLRKPDLQRTFLAPPDKSLVRIEELRVFPHPTLSHQSLVLLSEFDGDERHRFSTLSWHHEEPDRVLEELSPCFGMPLMTGFSPSAKLRRTASTEARALRSYMEASVHLVRQLVLSFGKPEWTGEVLSGLSLVVGAYLMGNGIPRRDLLQELDLPLHIFLEAFEVLEHYLTRPEARVRLQQQAETAGVSFEELAAFQWLLYNLTDGELTPEEQSVARDLAQVFRQYRMNLQGLHL